MTPFQLVTERLVMRHLAVDDAPLMLDLLNSIGWLQFIGDRGVRNVEDARRYWVTRQIASHTRHGFGHFHLARRSDGAGLGICGLVKRDTLEDADVGFALLPNFVGHGYATEATTEVIRFAQTASVCLVSSRSPKATIPARSGCSRNSPSLSNAWCG